MSEKAQAMINELIAACIAFGRQVEPDWQTRIDKAQRELREYIDELERDCDMLFRSAANNQPRKNTQTQTFVYGKEGERFTVHSDIERQDDKWIPEVQE